MLEPHVLISSYSLFTILLCLSFSNCAVTTFQVNKWPQIPIYETPPEIADDSASEDEDKDSDEEGEASLKLELDNGDDDDEEIDDEDEDESIDGVSGEESPLAKKKKKKKKRSKRKKKKKSPGLEDEESLAMSAAEGDYEDGVNLPPKPPPSAAEVALAEAVSRASMDELPPPSSSSASSALSKKRGGPVVQWRVPKVERYEKAPMPPGLVLPNGLVTRDDFMELSGSAGITLKQLNKLQCLLEPSDPSFAGKWTWGGWMMFRDSIL